MNREPLNSFEEIIAKQRQRIKEIKNHKKNSHQKPSKNQEHLVIFNAKEYPFKNQYQKGNHTYKTIINSETVEDILQKLILLAHPNIIQIQKIAKSKPVTHTTLKMTTFYSLYYEVVTYSLKRRMKNSGSQRNLPPLPNTNELCHKLVEVAEYLMGVDLFYLINLENIGITHEGQIKVYVSPLVIADPKNKHLSKAEVMTSIDKVMGWWSSALSVQQNTAQMSQQGSLTNSYGFSNSEKKEKPKISSSLIEPKFNIPNEYIPLSPKGKDPFPDKIKNIEEQIKNIRSNFNDKMKDRQRKRSDNSLFQIQDTTQQCARIFQSANLRQRMQQKHTPQQSIQQNIHCINIYNHPPQQKSGTKKPKNMASKPLYSFTYDNENNFPAAPQNLVRFKSQPPADIFPDDDLRHEQEEDDNCSVDTYQMDMGLQFEAPIVVNNEFRSSLSMPKEHSERNFNAQKHEANPNPRKPEKERKGSNQVIAHKNFTQSAGPLQFKNFVVQFIKPQFLAKKSNIYEDPDEYDSEKSRSASGRSPVYYKEIGDAGKSVASYHQNSVSLKRSNRHSSDASTNKMKKDKKCSKKSPDKMARLEHFYPGSNTPKNRIDQNLIKNQKSQVMIRKSIIEEKKINEKVQQALEKTRNAIAILKKVKAKQGE